MHKGGSANQPYYSAGLTSPSHFDLGPQIERGDAVLLAHLPDQSLIPPLNKFTPLFSSKDTLLRVLVPVESAASAKAGSSK